MLLWHYMIRQTRCLIFLSIFKMQKQKMSRHFFLPYLFLISQTSCEDEEKNVYTLNVVINQILRHFSYHIAYLYSIKSGAFKFYAHFHLFWYTWMKKMWMGDIKNKSTLKLMQRYDLLICLESVTYCWIINVFYRCRRSLHCNKYAV